MLMISILDAHLIVPVLISMCCQMVGISINDFILIIPVNKTCVVHSVS